MPRAYIGLGSNLGHSVDSLKRALELINSLGKTKVNKVSSLYVTEPVGYENQPWFYNCVAEIETELHPVELLSQLQQIENLLGRVRDIRWGPRTIDLDIILFNGFESNTEELTVPHPRMEERAFVLVPLDEIASEYKLLDGRTVREVRNRLNDDKKFSCIPRKIW
jgi:2-amino-4-hydroxy-6-hydroxymethyldihydropteridine diphosphokinase